MEEERSRKRWRGSLRAEGGCLSLLSAVITTFQTKYFLMNTVYSPPNSEGWQTQHWKARSGERLLLGSTMVESVKRLKRVREEPACYSSPPLQYDLSTVHWIQGLSSNRTQQTVVWLAESFRTKNLVTWLLWLAQLCPWSYPGRNPRGKPCVG